MARKGKKRRRVAEPPDPPTVQCKNCNRVIYETDANEHGWCLTCIEESNKRLAGRLRIDDLEAAVDTLIDVCLTHGAANLTGNDVMALIKVRHSSKTDQPAKGS